MKIVLSFCESIRSSIHLFSLFVYGNSDDVDSVWLFATPRGASNRPIVDIQHRYFVLSL